MQFFIFQRFFILVISTNKLRLRERTGFSLLLHVLKYVKPSLILFDIRIYHFFKQVIQTASKMTSDDDVVTLEDIEKAREIIMKSPLNVRKTPLLKNMTSYFPELDQSINLHLKLESLQTTG